MKPYGCWNKTLAASYHVQIGWTHDGKRIMREHTDPMSRGCRYDKAASDERCVGCAKPVDQGSATK